MVSWALALLLMVSRSPQPHPIHTSVLELTWNERSGALSGTLRIFEDDLSAAARSAGVDATAYALARVRLTAAGRIIALTPCGATRLADAVLVCVRGTVASLRGLRVRNTVLMDLHDDQINIVRIQGSRPRTLLLTAAAPEESLSP